MLSLSNVARSFNDRGKLKEADKILAFARSEYDQLKKLLMFFMMDTLQLFTKLAIERDVNYR